MARTMADKLFLKVLGTLNEAQTRWYVAREVIARGRGGLKAMHELTGMSRSTITRGIRELQQDPSPCVAERVRRPGGGRKRLEHADPGLTSALEKVMDENTAGDPMGFLRWTNKSTERIAEELTRQGHRVSGETTRRRLGELGYSLQANAKSLEGVSPPERDAQFRYINKKVKTHLRRGEPVLSIDTKKKERVGNFKNSGKRWHPKGHPDQVRTQNWVRAGFCSR